MFDNHARVENVVTLFLLRLGLQLQRDVRFQRSDLHRRAGHQRHHYVADRSAEVRSSVISLSKLSVGRSDTDTNLAGCFGSELLGRRDRVSHRLHALAHAVRATQALTRSCCHHWLGHGVLLKGAGMRSGIEHHRQHARFFCIILCRWHGSRRGRRIRNCRLRDRKVWHAAQFGKRFHFAIPTRNFEQVSVQGLLGNLRCDEANFGRAAIGVMQDQVLRHGVPWLPAPAVLVNHSIVTTLGLVDRRKSLLARDELFGHIRVPSIHFELLALL